MRKKIIAANWKMFMTKAETAAYWTAFNLEINDNPPCEIVIAPTFTSLPKLSELTENTQKISLAGQNFYPEKSGAFTGEISAEMLRELYARYVILGHSERRQYFGEDDAFINKKVLFALQSELRPILCVGESLEERDAGKEEAVLEKQLRGGLAGVTPEQAEDIVIAYEPVWAIGTGRTASPQQAQDAHAHIRKILAQLVGEEIANKMRIQYGGSVKPANAAELLSQPDIDGALVGGASLDPRSFAEIIAATAQK
ncbi:MAG: triose-phosphate isomerase [Chthoniobacterales bacterium]